MSILSGQFHAGLNDGSAKVVLVLVVVSDILGELPFLTLSLSEQGADHGRGRYSIGVRLRPQTHDLPKLLMGH
jgi:hypothetical protein